MDIDAAVLAIEEALRREARPEHAASERAYLKSGLEHFGVSVPAIRRVTRAFMSETEPLEREVLLDLVRALWRVGVHEMRMVAVELLAERTAVLEGRDLPLLERLVRDAGTWALVDPLAVQVVGPVIEGAPDATRTLEAWGRADQMWLRRAAVLAHLQSMRRGDEGALERFACHADPLLDDRDPFIRKAIGWVLRERGRTRPDEVGAWLLERRDRAAGLTLREASRHLGDDWRRRLGLAERRSRTRVSA